MKPYWKQDNNKIYQGHVLDVLRKMPDASVHCVVTSPPYWGLRNYNLPSTIWDSEPPDVCEHVWKIHYQATKHPNKPDNMPNTGNINQQGTSLRSGKPIESNFCQICGAWKGCLGLEPTIDLYIQHMVEIFREVKRVLRNDGSLFLNMGDSYAHSGACGGESPDGPRKPRAKDREAQKK